MKPLQTSLLAGEWDRFGEPDPKPVKVGPEELFDSQCRMFKLPQPERQLLFAKATLGRKWAFDFAWRDYMVAVEIDGVAVKRLAGQLVVMGRHASIDGIRGDHQKKNSAILLGWSVLTFLQTDVKPQLAIEWTMRVLAARGWKQ